MKKEAFISFVKVPWGTKLIDIVQLSEDVMASKFIVLWWAKPYYIIKYVSEMLGRTLEFEERVSIKRLVEDNEVEGSKDNDDASTYREVIN